MSISEEKSISKKILLEQIINKTYESDKILTDLEKDLNKLSDINNELSKELSDINNELSELKLPNLPNLISNSIKLKDINSSMLEFAKKLKQ